MTTLNEYIIQSAGRANGSAFLREFSSTEVFFSIEAPSEHLKDGPYMTTSKDELRLQTAQMAIGPCALFFTSRSDVRLFHRFAGLPLLKAAEMIVGMPNIEGILIQSDSDAWFAADKHALIDAVEHRH